MLNTQAATGLLKSGEPTRVKGQSHGESQGIVGHHGFDAIGESLHHMLEKGGSGNTGLIEGDAGHSFAAEVIHGGERALRKAGRNLISRWSSCPGRCFS